MAKRKKRNAITLVSLLLALAALIGFYYWYSHRPVKDNQQEATNTIALATIDTTQISSMHYVMSDADLTLILQNGTWISKDEPGRPITQGNVTDMLRVIKDIKADRIINDKPDNLADFGLAQPKEELDVTLNDGTVTTIKIGDVAGASLGYYGMVNNDGKVYLLPIEIGTALQYNNTQMTDIQKAPVISETGITSISITNRDGEDFEIKSDASTALDNSGNNLFNWMIPKPYGPGYSADYNQIETILPNYTTFNFIKNADYSGKNFAKYGLDNPAATIDIGFTVTTKEALPTPELDPTTGQTVTEKDINTPSDYKFYVGNKDEDGNYYIRVDGNDSVYTLSADTVDKMLKVDPFSLMNHYVCIPNIQTVDKVVLTTAGTTYTMDIKHDIKANADGTQTDNPTYYFNGKEADSSAFTSLYKTMVSPLYEGELKEDVNTDNLTPFLTISFHIFGDNETTVSASFLPYNDNFFIVKKDDGAHFLVDKRVIEDMAKAVSSFTGTK